MGQHQVESGTDQERLHRFSRALLEDLEALERMCAAGMIEADARRIGFEQEMFLAYPDGRPAPVATPLLQRLDDPAFTTELGLYNIEYNVPPWTLESGCLASFEATLNAALDRVRATALELGAAPVLVGTLPSIELADLVLENITPLARYRELDRLITSLCGGEVRTLINGRDELQVSLRNIMLETCNTSIQIHLQVDLANMPRLYNIAQLVAGPMVAAAANSPLLLQHRLWHESRIPAFEQSVDIRPAPGRQRDTWQRVHFGVGWVNDSILEVYRDQVARHRVTLMADTGESSLAILARGEIPPLRALGLHNGSVYRWNRPCYGITNGKPHLRIEHRPLPSGPTVLDEVANTALYLGLVIGIAHEYGDIRERFAFGDVKSNFLAAARYGLEAVLQWENGERMPARELLRTHLLPMARRGLLSAGITMAECDRYLGAIAGRVETGRNGARWQLDAFEALNAIPNRIARAETVTRIMMARQATGEAVHTWALPTAADGADWVSRCERVSQLMTADVFTVSPDDLVDVAARVMKWKHIRHVPVEDDTGRLVGLLSHRGLLEHWAAGNGARPAAVREMMEPNPPSVGPLTSCRDALRLMKEKALGCLPVVHDGRLVGIISERDFLPLAARWLDEAAALKVLAATPDYAAAIALSAPTRVSSSAGVV